MTNDSNIPASASSAEAASEPPADVNVEQPPSEPIRHPTGPSVTPTAASNAGAASPGAEIHSHTGMFPVQSPLRKDGHHENPTGKRLAILTLTALGVVYLMP